MLPSDLKPEQFSGYPPEARKLVTEYVGVLQRLPLSFVPSLLREIIDYDFSFRPNAGHRKRNWRICNLFPAEQVKEWFQRLRADQACPPN